MQLCLPKRPRAFTYRMFESIRRSGVCSPFLLRIPPIWNFAERRFRGGDSIEASSSRFCSRAKSQPRTNAESRAVYSQLARRMTRARAREVHISMREHGKATSFVIPRFITHAREFRPRAPRGLFIPSRCDEREVCSGSRLSGANKRPRPRSRAFQSLFVATWILVERVSSHNSQLSNLLPRRRTIGTFGPEMQNWEIIQSRAVSHSRYIVEKIEYAWWISSAIYARFLSVSRRATKLAQLVSSTLLT